MWKCKRCDRSFANKNQTHSCGRHDLGHHFSSRPPRIRALFDHFLEAVRAVGTVTVLPEKTRIAFQVRMSFAQVTPRQHHLDGHLVLAERHDEPFFTKIEVISQRNIVHHFRLAQESDLTPAFLTRLREAYAVGEQKHLRRD